MLLALLSEESKVPTASPASTWPLAARATQPPAIAAIFSMHVQIAIAALRRAS